jgi:hypothetical protein
MLKVNLLYMLNNNKNNGLLLQEPRESALLRIPSVFSSERRILANTSHFVWLSS